MQQINPFQDASEWAADELVKIAKDPTLTLKERIALLKDICDRGGLVKGSNVTKKVLSVRYDIPEVAAAESQKLLEEVKKLEEARRSIDERIKGVSSIVVGEVKTGRQDD